MSVLRTLFLTSFILAAPAAASEPVFTGPHVSVVAGWDQTDIGPSLPAREGLLYGLAAGYDWAAGPVRLGVEAEVNESSAEGTIGAVPQRVGRSLYLGGRFGVPIVGKALLYAKGGYANGRFSGPAPYTGNGWRIGGGGELALTGQLFLRAEFRYSDYGRVARGQQAAAFIGWRF